MSKHTPGPWTHEGHGDITGTENGRKYDVACVYLRLPAGRQEANAKLMAAAPDLLNALIEIVSADDAHELTQKHIESARATIAKATGGAA